MSRTYWRGIRARLDGGRSEYARKYVRYWLLTVASLGLLLPVRDVALYRHVMNNAWFGDKRFSYTGTSWPVYGAFFQSTLLMIIGVILYTLLAHGLLVPMWDLGGDPSAEAGNLYNSLRASFFVLLFSAGFVLVIALAFSVYRARLMNHFVDRLKLDGGVSFSLSPRASALSFAWLVLGNGLITIPTLGAGQPLARMRSLRYILSRLKMEDAVDPDGIRQSGRKAPKYGEGLVELLAGGTI